MFTSLLAIPNLAYKKSQADVPTAKKGGNKLLAVTWLVGITKHNDIMTQLGLSSVIWNVVCNKYHIWYNSIIDRK